MMHHCLRDSREHSQCPHELGQILLAQALEGSHEVMCADHECKKNDRKFKHKLSASVSSDQDYSVWQIATDPSVQPHP